MKRRKVEQVFVDVARSRRKRLEPFFIPAVADIVNDYVGFFKGELVKTTRSCAEIAVSSRGELMTAKHYEWDFGRVSVGERMDLSHMPALCMAGLQNDKFAIVSGTRVEVYATDELSYVFHVECTPYRLIGVGDDQIAICCASWVQVWTLGVLTCTFKLTDVNAMAFKPGLLFCGDSSGQITAWDLVTQQKVFTLVHGGYILNLALKGDLLASASCDCNCKVWDLTSFECKLVLHHPGSVQAVEFLDDFIVTAHLKFVRGQFEIDVWDYSGKKLTALRDHTHTGYPVCSMVLSGGSLVSFSMNRSVCIWN